MNKTSYLQSIEVFKGLDSEEMQKINHQTTLVNYRAGHILFMPDEPAEVLFILKKGRIQLYRLLPDGRKLSVSILQPGTIFGHMTLVGQNLHQTFAEALDDCLVCVWSRHSVERMLMDYPNIALRFLESMGQRLLDLEQQLVDVTSKSVPARLASLLIRLDEEHGKTGVVEGYTHQSLAEMLGTYRETTTSVLSDFKKNKLIHTGRKSIRILNTEGLQKVATL